MCLTSSTSLLLHLLKNRLDPLTARFRKTPNCVGFLTSRLDFDSVPEPARMVMVACDLLPGDIFIGVTQPEETPTLDYDLLGAELDLLGNEPASQYDSRKQRCLGRKRLYHRDLLFS